MDFLTFLPVELQCKILSYVRKPEYICIGMVSRGLFSLVKDLLDYYYTSTELFMKLAKLGNLKQMKYLKKCGFFLDRTKTEIANAACEHLHVLKYLKRKGIMPTNIGNLSLESFKWFETKAKIGINASFQLAESGNFKVLNYYLERGYPYSVSLITKFAFTKDPLALEIIRKLYEKYGKNFVAYYLLDEYFANSFEVVELLYSLTKENVYTTCFGKALICNDERVFELFKGITNPFGIIHSTNTLSYITMYDPKYLKLIPPGYCNSDDFCEFIGTGTRKDVESIALLLKILNHRKMSLDKTKKETLEFVIEDENLMRDDRIVNKVIESAKRNVYIDILEKLIDIDKKIIKSIFLRILSLKRRKKSDVKKLIEYCIEKGLRLKDCVKCVKSVHDKIRVGINNKYLALYLSVVINQTKEYDSELLLDKSFNRFRLLIKEKIEIRKSREKI